MNFKFKELTNTIQKGGSTIFLQVIGGIVAYFILVAIVIGFYLFNLEVKANQTVDIGEILFGILIVGIIILFLQTGFIAGIITSYRTLVETGKLGNFFKGMQEYILKFFGYGLLYTFVAGVMFYMLMSLFDGVFIQNNPIFFYVSIMVMSFIIFFALIPLLTFTAYEGNPFKHTLKFLDRHGNVYFILFLGLFIITFIPLFNLFATLYMYFVLPLHIMVLYNEKTNEIVLQEQDIEPIENHEGDNKEN